MTGESGNLVVRARDALRDYIKAMPRPFAPPSGLPAISPTRGEIGRPKGFRQSSTPPISPLVGEMAGRPEGGAKGRGVSKSTRIKLEKNLPIASGIGGGSSDAAAALKALNRLWNAGLDEGELAEIGIRLGADVPMCLHAGPLVARGVGDEIEPLPGFPALGVVLVNPGAAVATPEVFRALRRPGNPPLPPLPERPDLDALVGWLRTTRNDLQEPAVGLAPSIAEALAEIEAERAAFARMSGSGATCFGLFGRQQDASRAATAIRGRRPGWFVAATSMLA